MVAAAKLRRAQQAVVGARPYGDGLRDLIQGLLAGDVEHPLFLPQGSEKKASLLVYTSNRGLCGGFNSNLLRRVSVHLTTVTGSFPEVDLRVIGKKGRDYFKARNVSPKEIFIEYADKLTFADAQKMAGEMIAGFLQGEYGAYQMAYNRFKSALSQDIQIKTLLPITLEKTTESAGITVESGRHYIYEPSKNAVLDLLIPKYLAIQLYSAHLESVASELGARMAAMENATNNASDMIGRLTLKYNRARQAAITTELMDIVNGAESIK